MPPYTEVRASISRTIRSGRRRAPHACALCGSRDSYLDEVVTDDQGSRMFVCSDTDYCGTRAGQRSAGRE